MKALVPYIFPLLVVLIVFFLIFRWYGNRQNLNQDIGEGITIENLSESELSDVLKGVGDYKTVELESVSELQSESSSSDSEQTRLSQEVKSNLRKLLGVVKYELDGDRLRLSVVAEPEEVAKESFDSTDQPKYTVWLKKKDAKDVQRAFELVDTKGGLVGSGSLSVSMLPLEVYVTQGNEWRDDLSLLVLRGEISSEEVSNSSEAE